MSSGVGAVKRSLRAVRQLISRGFGERATRIVRGIPETENRYRIWSFSPSRSFPPDADLINNGSAPDPLPPVQLLPLLSLSLSLSLSLCFASPFWLQLAHTESNGAESRSPDGRRRRRWFDLNWNVRNKGTEWRAREIKQPAISRGWLCHPTKARVHTRLGTRSTWYGVAGPGSSLGSIYR